MSGPVFRSDAKSKYSKSGFCGIQNLEGKCSPQRRNLNLECGFYFLDFISNIWMLMETIWHDLKSLQKFEYPSLTNLEPGRISLRRRAQWGNGVLMFELKPSSWHWAGDQDHRLLSLQEMSLTTNQRPWSRALHQPEIRKVSPGALPVHNKEVTPYTMSQSVRNWAVSTLGPQTMIWSQDPSFLHRLLMSSKLSHCAVLGWGLRGINVKYRLWRNYAHTWLCKNYWDYCSIFQTVSQIN